MSGMSIHSDTTVATMSKLMEMAQLQQRVNSHNLANANTPGFIRQEVNFLDNLKRAVGSGDSSTISAVEGDIAEDFSIAADASGNNVEAPTEMNEMMQNGIMYNLMTRAYSTRMSIMRSALKGPQ